jgi:hypothetical protein
MQQVIASVAEVIAVELNRAKARIAQGRTELKAQVDKLPKDLRALGKQATGEFGDKFDQLTDSVDSKGNELVSALATKYKNALSKVDEEIEAEKEKNSGLIARAINAIKAVIKTILELKDLLFGVLAKAVEAVGSIIAHPIRFLGNLVSAVGAGLEGFMSRIGEHLKKGLVSWLLGSAGSMGIEIPKKFDLQGIIMMIAGMLGLTWDAIKARVISRGIPAKVLEMAEGALPIIARLRSEGIGALWEMIVEKVGDLKEMLFTKISEYLVPEVLKAGIMWIISLLNPASAFIKACKMIIDIVVFIVTRGKQIIEFVDAVLDAVVAIAKGGTGGVPAMIEKALAKSIPVLIGALAAILGIGGIAEKVKKFIQSLSKPVMKAVDWVTDKIVSVGKSIWGKMKSAGRRLKDRVTSRGRPRATDPASGRRPSPDKQRAAITDTEQLFDRARTHEQVARGIGPIGRRHGVSLRLVVESRTEQAELLHVQTMSTGSHKVGGAADAELDTMKAGLSDKRAIEEFDRMRTIAKPEKLVKNLRSQASSGQLEAMLIRAHTRRTTPVAPAHSVTPAQMAQLQGWIADVNALDGDLTRFQTRRPNLPGIARMRKSIKETRGALEDRRDGKKAFDPKVAERIVTLRKEMELAKNTPFVVDVSVPVEDPTGTITSEVDVVSSIKAGAQWKDSKFMSSGVATIGDVDNIWAQAQDQIKIAESNPKYHVGGKPPKVVFYFWQGITKDAARVLEAKRSPGGGRMYVRGKRH